jgi:hypothetical protein
LTESPHIWQYRFLEGIGQNVELKFTQMQASPAYPLNVSAALTTKLADLPKIGNSVHASAAPAVSVHFEPGFKVLETVVSSRLFRNAIGFDRRVEFAPIIHLTTAVLPTIKIPKLEFHRPAAQSNEIPGLNVFCRISNAGGRAVEGFYGRILPSDAAPQDSAGLYFLRRSVLFRPGPHSLASVVNDPATGDLRTV